MADTIATYIGNGTQTDFSVPFDYLKKSFVRVYLDETTLLTGGDYGDTSVDYYFLDNTTVRLKTPPANGVEVTIRRYTSATERIVSFEDASILKATDLDTSQLQSFHIAEEARDSVNDAMLKDSEANWDAQGNRIVNVGDPVDGKDAINLDWYNKGAGKVQENANKTEQWRNEAEGFRNEAETFKDEAKESYNLAKDWAIKMDGKVVEDAAEVDYSAKYWATSIKEYGVASVVVADNIDDVKQVSTNIEDVKLVGGDLEGSFSTPDFTDMGRVGTGSTDQVEITGGNIKIVADNIEDVKNVGTLIESGQVQIVIDSVETTNKNVIKAKQSEGLSRDWAIKTDGLVNNEDYSSKYYAQQAKASADSTSGSATDIAETITQAKQDISMAVTQGVSQVSSTGSTAVSNINGAYDQATENLETATQAHLAEVTTAGSTQVQAVNTAGTDNVSKITIEGNNQKATVTSEGTKQVGLVTTEGTNQVAIIKTYVDKAQQWAEKTDGEVEAGAYSSKYWAQQAAAVGGQSDWNEADTNSLAYIKNKPDLTVYALKTDISTILSSYATVDSLSSYATTSALTSGLATKVDTTTASTTYATKTELTTGLAGKANSSHTHTASQVTDFTAQVQSLINSSRITDYGRVGS